MRKLHLVCFVILMVSLFLAVAPAFAQDTPPAPTGDVAATLAAALEMLTKVVAAVTALPFTVGFVTAATALVKRVYPRKVVQRRGDCAHVPGDRLGRVDTRAPFWLWRAVPEWHQRAHNHLGAVGGLVASSYAATKVYQAAAVHNVPFIGYSRSPSPLIMAKKNALIMAAKAA
jgi:hypothetical protein